MFFIDQDHQEFYTRKVQELRADTYLRAFLYTVGICKETREHWNGLYSVNKHEICPEQIQQPWQTGTSRRITRLAFQLYTDGTPTAETFDDNDKVTEDINECRMYSVSDIFCCECAPYFVQAVQIRYPEYFQRVCLEPVRKHVSRSFDREA